LISLFTIFLGLLTVLDLPTWDLHTHYTYDTADTSSPKYDLSSPIDVTALIPPPSSRTPIPNDMNTDPPAPLKIIIYYPATSPDPDRHQVEMRSRSLSAFEVGNHDGHTTASPVPEKTLEGDDTDVTSPGAIDCMHRPTSSEGDVEREVDEVGKEETMDDQISISPMIPPTSFSTPPSPVIHAVDSLILPRSKGLDHSKKRSRSPDVLEPILTHSSKKVRFLQPPEKPVTRENEKTCIPKGPSQGDSRFQATHQTFAPRGQCIHQHLAASSDKGCLKGIDVGVPDLCVQSFCKGFKEVEAEIPPILIVSIDCVGFKVPYTVLRTGR
jgi:hypothetical protein